MGGKGSGYTREKRLVDNHLGRKRNNNVGEVIPAGEQFHIPNHSGDHSAGHTGTPVNDLDIANKKYIDDSITTTENKIPILVSELSRIRATRGLCV